ncbi:MAG: hypothetical protein J6K32_11355 [Clostridia bacterium]|nr:hypothetical protein [Clostridia bacterium]
MMKRLAAMLTAMILCLMLIPAVAATVDLRIEYRDAETGKLVKGVSAAAMADEFGPAVLEENKDMPGYLLPGLEKARKYLLTTGSVPGAYDVPGSVAIVVSDSGATGSGYGWMEGDVLVIPLTPKKITFTLDAVKEGGYRIDTGKVTMTLLPEGSSGGGAEEASLEPDASGVIERWDAAQPKELSGFTIGKRYVLHAEGTPIEYMPDGEYKYAIPEDITFIIDEDGQIDTDANPAHCKVEGNKLTAIYRLGRIAFALQDMLTHQPIDGEATLKLVAGSLETQAKISNKAAVVTGLSADKLYEVYVTGVPARYLLPKEPVLVNIDEHGHVLDKTGKEVNVVGIELAPMSVTIQAIDEESNPIEDTTIELRGENGAKPITVKLNDITAMLVISEGIAAGSYELRVTGAKDGYVCPAGVARFTIGADGKVGLTDDGGFASMNGDVLTVALSPSKTLIGVKDESGKLVSGVVMKLHDKSGTEADRTFTSGTAATEVMGLSLAREYTLSAEEWPEGYQKPAAQTLSFSDDGTLNDPESAYLILSKPDVRVAMADEARNDILISGVGYLYRVDENGWEKDFLQEITFNEDDPILLEDLDAGESYILMILDAYGGYVLPTYSPTFTIDEEGNIDYNGTIDANGVLLAECAQSSVTIRAVDETGSPIRKAGIKVRIGGNEYILNENGEREIRGLEVMIGFDVVVTKAPEGYRSTKTAQVSIDEDGTVRYGREVCEDGVAEVVFVSTEVEVEFLPVDEDGEALYGKATIDVLQGGTTIVEGLQLTESAHTVKGVFAPGLEYTVNVTKANGFVRPQGMTFTLSEDGSVTASHNGMDIAIPGGMKIPLRETAAIINVVNEAGDPVEEIFVDMSEGGFYVDRFMTDAYGQATIGGLREGVSYTLSVERVPEGYFPPEDQEVVFDFTGEDGEVNDSATITLPSVSVKVLAVDKETGEVLSGAALSVADVESGYSKAWTSAQEAEKVAGFGTSRMLTLFATKAPDGYLPPEDILFAVNPDGTVLCSGTMREDGVILVEFEKNSVKIRAVDGITGEPVAGVEAAVLIRDASGLVTVVSDSIDHEIRGLTAGEYNIEIYSCPKGYYPQNDTQTFSLDAYGDVTGSVTVVDGVIQLTIMPVRLPMITVNRETGKRLAGAQMELVFNDETAYSWTSTEEVHVATGIAPVSYIVRTVTPPAGYLPAKEGTIFLDTATGKLEYSEGVTVGGVALIEFDKTKAQVAVLTREGADIDPATVEIKTDDEATGIHAISKYPVTIRGLTLGKTYTLNVVSAPEGYYQTSPATLKLNADGTIVSEELSADGKTAIILLEKGEGVKVVQEGGGFAQAEPKGGPKGTAITLTAKPDEGWRFKEWIVVSGGVELSDPSSSTAAFTMGSEAVEVRAVFEEIPHTITVTTEGEGTASADETEACVNTGVALTAEPAEGWRFKEWIVVSGGVELNDSTSTLAYFTMGEEDVEIKAVFEKITHTITVTAEGEGEAYASRSKAGTGENFSVFANPAEGWRFKEWIVVSGSAQAGGSGDDGSIFWAEFVMGDTDVEIKAVFEKITHTITVTTEGSGTASADMTSAEPDQAVELTAEPAEGWRFREWIVVSGGVELNDSTSTAASFVMGDTDVEIRAVFEPASSSMHAVRISIEGSGTVQASKAEGLPGETIILTAAPAEGWRFREWIVVSGGVTLDEIAEASAGSSPAVSFVMGDTDVEIKAVFEPINAQIRRITVTAQGGGTAGADKTEAAPGETVILTARPEMNWRFREFTFRSGAAALSEVSYGSDRSAEARLIMGQDDVEILAVFEEVPEDERPVIITPEKETHIRVYENEKVTMTVEAENADSYLWAYSTDGGNRWAIIEGADGATLTIDRAQLSQNGYLFRCTAMNAEGGMTNAPTFTLEVVKKVILPETGDTSSLALWTAMMGLCLGGMVILRRRAKRA